MNLQLPKDSNLIYTPLANKGLRLEFKKNAPLVSLIVILGFLLIWFGLLAVMTFGAGNSGIGRYLTIPFWIAGVGVGIFMILMFFNKESIELYADYLIYRRKRLFLYKRIELRFDQINLLERAFPARIQRLLDEDEEKGKDQSPPIHVVTERKSHFWFHQLEEGDLKWLSALLIEIWSNRKEHLLH
jgi:hypothetical protein